MRSRPPKYTQRPGAEILVLRRAGFPYGAVFAGWRADSSAAHKSDSPTGSWATNAPLSFAMRNDSPAPNAGAPRRGGFRRMGWKRRPVELDRLRPRCGPKAVGR